MSVKPRILGPEPVLHPGAVVRGGRLGPYTEIGEGARLLNVDFGAYSYTDRFADLANAQVGKFANIAGFTRVNPGDHPMERASQHHFLYRSAMYWPGDAEDDPDMFERRAGRPVRLGHDVWLGHGAIVLSGRTLETGSVLGAGSVLTKDAGPYEIWVGAPARKVKDRFDAPLKERLLALSWWDWDHDRLRAALDDFRALSVEAFLERYEGG